MRKMSAVERLEEPKQLEFFDKGIRRISGKDKQRSMETITKELIRIGIPPRTISSIMGMITDYSDELKHAAEAIDCL